MTTRSTDTDQYDLRDVCPSGGWNAVGSDYIAWLKALARDEALTQDDDLPAGYSPSDETVVLGERQMVRIPNPASAMSIIDGADLSTIIYGAQTSEVVLMRPDSLEGDAMAVVVFWDPKPPKEAEVCRSIGVFDSKPAPGGNTHTWFLTGPGYEASLAAVREGMHRLGTDESMTASADVASSAAVPGVLLEFTVRVPKRYAELPVGEIVDGVLSPWIDVFEHLTRDVHRAGTVAPLYRELGSRVLDRKMHF